MNIKMRDLRKSDYDFVLRINEENVEVLSPIDRAKVEYFEGCADMFKVVEVDTIPYNEPSLKFHEAMGFHEVGEQIIRGGTVKVSLQAREINL